MLKFESKTSQKSKLWFISKLENRVGLNKTEKPFCLIGCVEYDKINRLPITVSADMLGKENKLIRAAVQKKTIVGFTIGMTFSNVTNKKCTIRNEHNQ